MEQEWKRRYEADLREVKEKIKLNNKSTTVAVHDSHHTEEKPGFSILKSSDKGADNKRSRSNEFSTCKFPRANVTDTSGFPPAHRVSQGYRVFRGLSQDFSLMCEKPKRVSFVIGRDTDRSVRDFSTEFALPSPIPIVSVPLDETTTLTPMVPRTTVTTSMQKRSCSRGYYGNKIRQPGGNDKSVESAGSVSDKGVVNFHIEELHVSVGELRSTLTSKYREYNIATLVTVGRVGSERQHSNSRTLRYSAARQVFHDDLARIAKKIGVLVHFECLLTSFPPKSVTKSTSSKTAEYRATALRSYILSACDIW